MPLPQTRRRAASIIALAVLTLGACGGADEAASPATTDATSEPSTTAPTSAAPTTSAVPENAPVTIEHRYGSTTLDAAPERIVAIGAQWTDVLSALEAPIVATITDPTLGATSLPWQDLSGIEQIPASGMSIPFEAIAAAQPDLIVGSWEINSPEAYETLSEIAPTIALLSSDRQVDRWQDMALAAGDVLRQPDAGAALITDAESRSADLLAALPGLDGATYALANYVPGDAIYVVADPDDGASELFTQLGMQIDPDLLTLDGAESGRVALSLERIGELDADVLLLLTNGADPNEIPGWSALPAVSTDAVAVLEYADIVGLNTPSPLSVPYALDLIRPALEAAAEI